MYQRYGCRLYGIDTSQSMLEAAKARLGESAELRLADATQMPFESGFFDLAICMLALHEMDESVRSTVIGEIKRVMKTTAASFSSISIRADHARSTAGAQSW